MPKVKITRGLNKLRPDPIAQRYVGDEPNWTDFDTLTEVQIEDRFNRALNWYNYVLVDDDYFSVVEEFLKTMDYPADTIKAIRSLEWWEIPPAVAKMARMMVRGYLPSEQRFAWFSEKLDETVAKAQERATKNVATEKVKAAKAAIPIQSRVAEVTHTFLGEVDEQVDHFFETFDDKWRAYDWLVKKQVKSVHAAAIANHYRPMLNELFEARQTKADPDLKEAWAHLSPKRHLAAVNFIDAIVRDCDQWAQNAKASRRPRKRKIKSADKQVAKIKYQKEDTSLQMVSIDPTKIVGASEVWVYNTKYRILYHYLAQGADGFAIKGSTIKNADLKASSGRKLRKPKEFLGTIVNGGPKAIVKAFNAIKAKPKKAKGRFNAQTLIVRVVK